LQASLLTLVIIDKYTIDTSRFGCIVGAEVYMMKCKERRRNKAERKTHKSDAI